MLIFSLYPDLIGFEGWIDEKLIFNGLEAKFFHNHFTLTICFGS